MVKQQLNQTNIRMPLSAPLFPGSGVPSGPGLCLVVFRARPIKQHSTYRRAELGPDMWSFHDYDYFMTMLAFPVTVECLINSKSLKTHLRFVDSLATLPLPPTVHLGSLCHSLCPTPLCAGLQKGKEINPFHFGTGI